ncbi:VWA domain-containing protein [Halosquirtibacter laminarini]|uniref:VWA domain-containing protein n=2 Tax=Halosquirtibacter laminarini TaxID=3374600 RepID=A0AC61NQF7_9BACT|nr:VWA domain-containing protein [Prolixibacteraceae bacterium]
MDSVTFAHPKVFYGALLLIPYVAWYLWKRNQMSASLKLSTTNSLAQLPKSWKYYGRHLVPILNVGVVLLLLVCLARPQSFRSWENSQTKGIDIVMAIDVSSSMLAQDFSPDRLEAAKEVAQKFIAGRPNDRIGLVVFSGESFTQCPLTTDHATLQNLFLNIKSGMIEDGTAIGSGLATSVSRLKDSKAKSKVIILLTDGANNRGEISPETAADIAQTYGIRVYTIGVGTEGMAPYPFDTPMGRRIQQVPVKIDEKTLEAISDKTDGQYFRATDNESLKQVYQEIDKLETSKIEVKKYSKKNEEFGRYALAALVLLLCSVLLRNTIFRNVP